MNQILNQMYGNDNNRGKKDIQKSSSRKFEINRNNYAKADIVKVGKIFSIMLIIFGIIFV